jgi:threonine synthase
VIGEYGARLPAIGHVVTLGEGGTPLLPAPTLSELTGCDVHLKIEGLNPTGSFKDRGMTVAVSLAAARGARTVICASTGNTSASAAAYAARAGMDCVVRVPRGKIALGKTSSGHDLRRQAAPGGQQLRRLPGARAQARSQPPRRGRQFGQPRPAEGETAAFEIVDVLGDAPQVHCLPVGTRQHLHLLDGLPGYLVGGRSSGRRECSAFRPPAPRRW